MRVSCIIPAYNEGARIGSVLKAVVGHPLVDEVIVIDDGSDDDTGDRIRAFPSARLISQERNEGKSRAIADGTRAARGEYLLFLDADLIGLTPVDVTALLKPVLDGRADTSISLRRDALLPWRVIGLDYLSGERVIPRKIIDSHIVTIAHLSGFGLESFLNDLILTSGARLQVVWWPTVGHTYKVRKYGMWKGLLGEVRMLANIVETVSLIGTTYQLLAMHRARVL
ncbi:MAG: glycosyltransferase [Patescibacteria group bacterium]|nr:glycosyltransferase [Patescibacteria group bacterium]MDE1945144.1 glycosyltransferase [Patescibacteria group bacterium]MDE2057679.1 glycosyltransferase [Patescibacteria group bacterium]